MDAGGDVHCQNRAARGVDDPDRLTVHTADIAVQAGSQHGVHNDIRPGDLIPDAACKLTFMGKVGNAFQRQSFQVDGGIAADPAALGQNPNADAPAGLAKQAGNDHPTGIPTGVFPTSDGHINIAAASERVWERMCDAMGHSEWKARPEYRTRKTRSDHRVQLNGEISEITKTKPSAHWVELFEESGVPCGPIYSIDQVFADPQVQHLGMAAPVTSRRLGDTHIVNSAVNVEGIKKKIRSATPEAGEHTNEILKSIGYSDADIAQLKTKGAI